MRRTGKVIREASDLMWLMLTRLSQGQTLANLSALSEVSGLGPLSDVAIMKRLIHCGNGFKWILSRLTPASVADYLKPKGLSNYRVLAVDGSDVRSGGSRFSKSWRLHFALDLFTLTSHEFRITNDKTGETLTNFTMAPGDLFLVMPQCNVRETLNKSSYRRRTEYNSWIFMDSHLCGNDEF